MHIELSRIELALVGAGVYLVFRSIYRLYFHPLSKIPGPKLPILSQLYEFYYDVLCGGKFIFVIEDMHKKYGPIVRINAREVHISDPHFYDDIYTSGARPRDKDPEYVTAFSLPTSLVSTISHDLHRTRRNVLNSFFSKRSVMELGPLVEGRVQKLIQRFEEFHKNQKVVQLDNAYSALTSDIITFYCYGKSGDFLGDENFRTDIRTGVADATRLSHINRFFPYLTPTLMKVPPQVMKAILPGKSGLFDFQKTLADQAVQSLQGGKADSSRRATIYDKLTDPSIPAEERSLQRISEESFLVLGAGTETTSRILTVATYYLSQNRPILERLRAELKQALPTPESTSTWTELEKVPYLTGVIRECLRLGFGLVCRLPRVPTNEVLKYQDYEIPIGTPVSTSSYFVHLDPTIYPDPNKFDPERWIQADGTVNDKLFRYITSFTKGSRICLGMNLAYSELYLTIAYVSRRFDFEMHDTTPEDVRIISDFLVGYTRRGDMRVYAKVVRRLQE